MTNNQQKDATIFQIQVPSTVWLGLGVAPERTAVHQL